jgi:uncharacterized protein
MQEKLSLSDRFGIRVVFPSPDQRRYLAVVEALAAQRGLALDTETLRRRGLQWAEWHNGRSGRTARQFIDHLEGELGVAARAAQHPSTSGAHFETIAPGHPRYR